MSESWGWSAPGHKTLGPSSSSRWMTCAGSVRLSSNVPHVEPGHDSAAAEGTRAHAWAEARLRQEFLGEPIPPTLEPDDQEMADLIEGYVQEAWRRYDQMSEPIILIEQWVDITEDVGGTADLILVDLSDGTLLVQDLKAGRIYVEGRSNPQLRLYAAGALLTLQGIVDVKRVEVGVYQPRIQNFGFEELDPQELLDWVKVVERMAALTYHPQAPIVAGEHCTFCPVAPTCETRMAYMAEKYHADLVDTEEGCLDREIATPERLAEVLSVIPDMKKWIASVEQYSLDLAMHGTEIPGFKVGQTRGRRVVPDPEALKSAMQEAGFSEAAITKKDLLGIAALDKLSGGKKVFMTRFGEYVRMSEGRPKLVPSDSPLQPIESKAFDDLD